MLNIPISSPFSPSWSRLLVPLCSVNSRSIPLAWHQTGQCQQIPCPGLAWGCGMWLSWNRCSAPGCGAASLGPGAAGHPSAPNGVLDPLLYRFSQITPLAANRTCCPCKIAYFHLRRFELQMQISEPKEEWHHLTMRCINPSIQEESSNTDGDVLVMAISLSGTSATRSKSSSEWQSFPNEHVSHLGIENTHPSVPWSRIPV